MVCRQRRPKLCRRFSGGPEDLESGQLDRRLLAFISVCPDGRCTVPDATGNFRDVLGIKAGQETCSRHPMHAGVASGGWLPYCVAFAVVDVSVVRVNVNASIKVKEID